MSALTFTAQLSLDFIFSHLNGLPREGEEVAAPSFSMQLGGGTLTYPVVLTRLGLDCKVILKKSKSRHADLAFRLLGDSRIKEVMAIEVDYDPVMTTAVLSSERDRSFVSHNDERALRFDDDFLYEQLKNSKVVFAPERNPEVLRRLKQEGAVTVFDVGWSEDMSLAAYADILRYVDYFTPNDKEAMKLTGTSTVEESLMVLKDHVAHTIVSCGKQGAATISGGTVVRVGIPEGIQAVDTTGAGDNFMAGLIYAIHHDMQLEDCLKWAVCAGSLSTTGYGCYGAAYTADDIRRRVPALVIQKGRVNG